MTSHDPQQTPPTALPPQGSSYAPKHAGHKNMLSLLRSFTSARQGFALFVLIPTLIAFVYYIFIASDQYVSEAKYAIKSEGNGGMDVGQIFTGISDQLNQQDALILVEYLKSPSVLQELSKTIDVDAIFNNEAGDYFSTMGTGISKESRLSYFTDHVKVIYDASSGVTSLEVHAFDSAEAQQLNAALLDLAEEFVNHLSERIRKDAVDFAFAQTERAKQAVIDATADLTDFRQTNADIDPMSTTAGFMELLQNMEAQLAEKRAKLNSMQTVMTWNNPQLKQLRAEISATEDELAKLTARLSSADIDENMAKKLQEYNRLTLERDFAIQMHTAALQMLEGAHVESQKQRKFLVRIVDSTKPDEAAMPRRIASILKVFFFTALGYAIIAMLLGTIRDHVRM